MDQVSTLPAIGMIPREIPHNLGFNMWIRSNGKDGEDSAWEDTGLQRVDQEHVRGAARQRGLGEGKRRQG